MVSSEQVVQIAVVAISLVAICLSVYTFWYLHKRGPKLELISEKAKVETSANVVTLRGLCLHNDGTAPGVVEDIDISVKSRGQIMTLNFDSIASTETVYHENQWKLVDKVIPLPLVISPAAHLVINITAHHTEARHLPIKSISVLFRRKGKTVAEFSR